MLKRLLLIVAILVFPVQVHALLPIIEDSQEAGTATGGGGCTVSKDIENGTSSGTIALGDSALRTYVASKFQAGGTYSVCAIDLWLQRQDTAGPSACDHTVKIYSNQCTICDRSDDTPNVQVGGNGSPVKAWADLAITETQYSFTFADPPSLTNAEFYWRVIYTDAVDATNFSRVNTESTCTIEDVKRSADGTTWTSVSTTTCIKFNTFSQ